MQLAADNRYWVDGGVCETAPLARTDPTGLITAANCASLAGGILIGVSVQLCSPVIAYDDKTGDLQLGYEATVGISATSPGLSLAATDQVSSARTLDQLGGQFYSASESLISPYGVGGTVTGFGGNVCGAPDGVVVGGEAGVAVGLPGTGIAGGYTYTHQGQVAHLNLRTLLRELGVHN